MLALKITGDASGAKRAFHDAEGSAGGFGKKMAGVAAGAAAALGAVAAVGMAAFESASNLEQQAGAVDAIFGKNAAKMHGYAKQAATTVGLAQSEYSELASVLGAQLSNAGFEGDKLTGTVNGLVEKGADLAAQFGGSTADAVSALSSILKGETDPIERYGISLKQSDINARLAAQGQDELTGQALKNATAQAALALVTEQSKTAQGAFARESDTAAGKMATLSAMWENGKAALGAGLLPVFVTAANFLTDKVIPTWQRLTAAGGPLRIMFDQVSAFVRGQLIPAVAGLARELGPKLIPVFQSAGRIVTNFVVPAFMAIWKIVQQYVVPILRSVLSPALDGLQKLWGSLEDALERNRGKFSGLLDNVRPLLNFLKNTVAPFIGGALKWAFENLGGVIGGVVDAIAWVLDKASAIGGFVGRLGSSMFGAAPAPVAAAGGGGVFGAAPGVARFGAAGGAGGGGRSAGVTVAAAAPVVNITINGAVDRVGTARQIRELLADVGMLTGTRPAVSLGGLR